MHVAEVRGGDHTTVGGKGGAVRAGMLEGEPFAARGDVPEFRLAAVLPDEVPAAAQKGLAVQGEGHGRDVLRMAAQGGYWLSCGGVPESDQVVVAAGRQQPAVGGE